MLERRNSALMLPKLYVATIDELLGVFHRVLIVGAHQSNCSADKTVFVHDISSILGHIGVTPKGGHLCAVPGVLPVENSVGRIASGLGKAISDGASLRNDDPKEVATLGHSRDRISYPLATGETPMMILLTLQAMHSNSASMASPFL